MTDHGEEGVKEFQKRDLRCKMVRLVVHHGCHGKSPFRLTGCRKGKLILPDLFLPTF